MVMEVSLREVVDHLHMLSDESSAYLNTKNGEMVLLSDEEMSAAEEHEELGDYLEWQRERIQKAREVQDSDDYLELPTKFDIHEYRIVEEFCLTRKPPQLRDHLLRRIRGGGAFGRFKRAVYSLEIEKEWYRFRDAEYERIAVDWLEVSGISYRRDLSGEAGRAEQAVGADAQSA